MPKPAKVVGSLLAAEKIIWNGVQHPNVDVDFKKKKCGGDGSTADAKDIWSEVSEFAHQIGDLIWG